MVLAFVRLMLENGLNPSEKLWVQCIDVDRISALMCYTQLALWNVPAQVIHGNSLTMEIERVMCTPAHYMGYWDTRLNFQEATEKSIEIIHKSNAQDTGTEEHESRNSESQSSDGIQFDFQF